MDGAQLAHLESGAHSPRQLIRQVPWLAAVPAETLDRLADQAVLHQAPAQVRLFDQAETPGVAQFLIGGAIELLAVRGDDETLVELVRPFDLLLPAAVLNRQPYLLRARVREEARLLLIHAETFRRAVVADQALCLAVLACQAAQFRRQVKQAKAIRLRSAEERVGAYRFAAGHDPRNPVANLAAARPPWPAHGRRHRHDRRPGRRPGPLPVRSPHRRTGVRRSPHLSRI
jgi:hypothetical protein